MAESTMPDTAVIVRDVRVSDGAGGSTAGAAAAVGTFSCRCERTMTTRERQEISEGGKYSEVSAIVIVLPVAAAVQLKDKATISGRTFELVFIGTPESFEVERRTIGVEVA